MMLDIPDFVPHSPVAVTTIEAYAGLVPEEMVELWERYGYGSFGEGFVRVIDPGAYEARIGNLMGKIIGAGPAVPIMVTALADVIAWEPDRGVTGLLLRKHAAVGLGSRPRTLVRLTAQHGARHLARAFDWAPYPEALERLGVPAYDEAFVPATLRSADREAGAAALALRPALPAVEAMLDRQGPILH
ncbi:GAD-like domain-containing protein [Agrococcus sp. ARC_14]|uniref:GAD-like domain-containing protein n=1 Tax=Agrococcus sp. ARC_14 TaxID=2919927 RepID=UPI001F05CA6E|nr:GAD-like domain-containing protein [Agrococcus sp. ARC_14]MCH1881560.1 hypothetical protein [Agrococcus sp. ARC_14]